MRYSVVSSSEWTYPDRMEYESASQDIILRTPRNSYATAQVLLSDVPEGARVSVTASGNLSGLPLESYELVPVYVEDNPFLPKGEVVNGCPSRWAPFEIYDCVKPLGATLTPNGGVAGLYLSFTVLSDAAPGEYSGVVAVTAAGDTFEIPASIIVYKAAVPVEEHIKINNGYVSAKTAQYHNVETGSPELAALDEAYLKTLRRLRQNSLYTHGIYATPGNDGKYTFDFTEFEAFVTKALSLGFKYFIAPSIGWRESWKKPDINVVIGGVKIPAMSYEAYDYLAQYFKVFRVLLEAKGWSDRFYISISDEPNEENATVYRALCGLVRKLAPGMRLWDAVSYVPIHGALDCWVPLNSEYDMHRKEFETFRAGSDELWHYVCCGPRSEGYINRFMDYPLLSTRYLFWGNYLYNLSGYLHWAANHYQPGQDPFTQNCPRHINTDNETILPAGDTHIVYPGEDGPWMSMRLEAQRQSAEDFELLRLLAQKDKAKADGLCRRCFKSFNAVEYDVKAFNGVMKELYEAVSDIA